MLYEAFKAKYNIRLNAQQEIAVRKTDKPSLLLAVPGSGKTTVIVSRIGYMVFCAGIHPKNILTLTFSRAAASEMKERFCCTYGSESGGQLHFSTIHSFCLSMIRRAARLYGFPIPALLTDPEKAIRKVYLGIKYEPPADHILNELGQAIGYCKNRMICGAALEAIQIADLDFRRFYEAYEAYLKKNNLMDFDDMLLLAHELLDRYPAFLAEIQDQYRYINVDEAQDTSYIQHEIIKRIASKYRNLFLVGDEDQSIYGFRAAYPDALIHFKRDYPSAEILLLETNYRCASAIAQAAERIIRTCKNRYDKKMKTVRAGGRLKHSILRDTRLQYRFLAERLHEAARQGKQVTVLYRNNESAVPLADILEQKGISYWENSDDTFYHHTVAKDMINALRLATDLSDLDSYEKIYYKLGLYTTKEQAAAVRSMRGRGENGTVFHLLSQCEQRLEIRERIREFANRLEQIGRLRPPAAVRALNKLFYQQWLTGFASREGDSVHSLQQKLDTFLALTLEHCTIHGFLDWMEQKSSGENNSPGKDPKSCITLSTIHQSKGLEYDKVILIDLYQGILPSEKRAVVDAASKEMHLEEEIRLFYVAITRAKDEIEVVSAHRQFGNALVPSPFLEVLFPRRTMGIFKKGKKKTGSAAEQRAANPVYNAEAFRAGQSVIHKYFGKGTILERNGDVLMIRFEESGVKRMLLSACLKWNYIIQSG